MGKAEPVVYLSTVDIAVRFGVTRATVGQWIYAGVKGPGGAVVRLDARKIGGRYKATEAALEAFLRACDGRDAAPVSETEAARARRVAKDLADCDRLLYPKGNGPAACKSAAGPHAGPRSPGGTEGG